MLTLNKLIFTGIILLLIAASCRNDKRLNSEKDISINKTEIQFKKEEPVKAVEKIAKSSENGNETTSLTDSVSDESSNEIQNDTLFFTNRFADIFLNRNVVLFKIDKNIIREKELKYLEDEEMLKKLTEVLNYSESEEYPLFMFSLEDHIEGLQEFTVFFRTPDGQYLHYLVLDNNNKVLSSFPLAYEEAMGEYSERGDGEFVAPNVYLMEVFGMSDPYEDIDTVYPGSETSWEMVYTLNEDGTISIEKQL